MSPVFTSSVLCFGAKHWQHTKYSGLPLHTPTGAAQLKKQGKTQLCPLTYFLTSHFKKKVKKKKKRVQEFQIVGSWRHELVLTGTKTSLPELLDCEEVISHFRRAEIWTLLLGKNTRSRAYIEAKSTRGLQIPFKSSVPINPGVARTQSKHGARGFILMPKCVHWWCHTIPRCKRPFHRCHGAPAYTTAVTVKNTAVLGYC